MSQTDAQLMRLIRFISSRPEHEVLGEGTKENPFLVSAEQMHILHRLLEAHKTNFKLRLELLNDEAVVGLLVEHIVKIVEIDDVEWLAYNLDLLQKKYPDGLNVERKPKVIVVEGIEGPMSILVPNKDSHDEE